LNIVLFAAGSHPDAAGAILGSCQRDPKGQKRLADMNQLAKAIADIATGESLRLSLSEAGLAGSKVATHVLAN
jgi:hypothetical protein